MGTMAQFSRRMNKRADSVSFQVRKLVLKTALLVDQVLVLSTPVDTGVARSNWLPSLDGSRREVIPAYSPYPQFRDPTKFGEQTNARGAMDAARLVVAARTSSGQDIYFTNNVPYIAELNNGKSSQAPAAFVQMAVESAAAAIRQSAGTIVKENL